MNYKLIATDLDGTLFSKMMDASEENLNAIARLSDLGVYVVPATGRALGEIPDSIKKNPNIRYIISSNGAVIHDTKTEKCEKLCMKKELSQEIFSILFSYETESLVHYNEESYVDADKYNEENYIYHNLNEIYRKLIFATNIPASDFKNFCYSMDAVEMICTSFHSTAEREECMERLSKIKDVLLVSTTPYNMEVFNSKTSKGTALNRLCEMIGIDVSETIGMGDSGNDIPLLFASGLSLAVDNAAQHLKDVADCVICSNEQHAMKYVLDNFIEVK